MSCFDGERACGAYGTIASDIRMNMAGALERVMRQKHQLPVEARRREWDRGGVPLRLRRFQAEAALQDRDDRLLATAAARNAVEAYVYGTRGHLDHPDMQKVRAGGGGHRRGRIGPIKSLGCAAPPVLATKPIVKFCKAFAAFPG